jgi:glycosyltransferase involved in cell wall biosynthesis
MVAGGAQKIVLDLIAGLDRKSFEIHLIAGVETESEGSFWGQCEDLLDRSHLHPLKEMVRSPSIVKDIKAFRALVRLFKDIRPDIVHSHTSKAGVLARFAAHRAKVPRIIHSTHGLIYDPKAKIPGVGKGLCLKIFLLLERRVGKYTHQLIVLSEQEAGQAMSLGLAENSRVLPVGNGIPLVDFSRIERDVTNWKVAHLRLGIAGRLASEKGHELLLMSFKKLLGAHPHLSLKIAGDGPLRADLELKVKELGLEKQVLFMGYQCDMVAFLRDIDIFVLSSHYEGFGLVLVEAMAAGLPVVATDVGGVREVLVDGKTGIIVPAASEEELVMGIDYFLRHPHLAYQYGENGRDHAMAKFSRKQMLHRHAELYLHTDDRSDDPFVLEGYVPVDLHMHSCHSFDSKTRVEVILAEARDRGLKAISITDHDSLEGSLEAMEKAPPGLIVVPGMEISSDVGHIIALFITRPIVAVDLEGIAAEVKEQGGLLYLPHPFRGRRSLSLDLVEHIDVFEVLNGRSQGIDIKNDQFGDAEIVQFAQTYQLTGVGGSDAHKAGELFSVQTYLPHFDSLEELKAILKSGKLFPICEDSEWWEPSLDAVAYPDFT